MDLGVPELVVIVVAVLLLFGYKKLPDASRAIGRSLRIFKGEMKGLRDDDVRAEGPAPAATPVPALAPVTPAGAQGELPAQLLEEARAAEAHAAELRARAAQARAAE